MQKKIISNESDYAYCTTWKCSLDIIDDQPRRSDLIKRLKSNHKNLIIS